MAIEKTLSIVKPNSTLDNNIGNIIAIFEKNGLRISAARFAKLSKEKAEGFYIEHKERPFFNALVSFMTSGPVMIQVLEGEDAVRKNREIMGATNPKDAAAGTLRADYAASIDENAVHGSDAAASAARDIAFFFTETELCARTR